MRSKFGSSWSWIYLLYSCRMTLNFCFTLLRNFLNSNGDGILSLAKSRLQSTCKNRFYVYLHVLDFRCANKLTVCVHTYRFTHTYADLACMYAHTVVGQRVIRDLYQCQHEYTGFQFIRTFLWHPLWINDISSSPSREHLRRAPQMPDSCVGLCI